MKHFFQNPKILGFLIALLFAILTMWYYFEKIDQENYFLIDNPSAETVKIKLDENSYTLAAYQSTKIQLNKGKHSFISTINDSVIVRDSFMIDSEIRGLLNPTLSDYIIFTEYYAQNINKDSLLKAHSKIIDSVKYYGEISEENQFFIKDFYLNEDQEYLKVIKKMDSISKVTKIFRKENFIDFYKQYYK